MKEQVLESPLLADEEPAPADGAKGSTYAFVCALLASVPTIIYGYNRGVMSGAQKFVQADLGVTDAQLEVLIGATSVYSLVGSLAAGWACDRAGRRRTIVLSAALYLAGSAVTAAANGYAALMAGQLVAGVACGFGLVVAPVYIAEISPANARGFLSSIPEIASNSGILLSYIADLALAGLPTPLNWRLMIDWHRASSIPSGRRHGRHARDPALARPARPPRRGAPRAGAHGGGRRPLAPGDRDVRAGGHQAGGGIRRCAAVDERVARDPAAADARRPARDAGHPGAAGVPAGVRRGGHGAVCPAGVQPRRDHLRARCARRHRAPRRRQDDGDRGPAVSLRPPRPPAHAAHQRGRHGRVAACPRPVRARDHGRVVVGGRDVRRGGRGVHGDVLAGVRPRDLDVRVGDPAAAAARTGDRRRDGGEPGDERRRGDDLHLHVRGGGHGRDLLHLRGAVRGGVGVRLRVPA